MNKKVLTLCAGFLLAGGLVNFASADNLSDYKGTKVTEWENGTYLLVQEEATGSFALGVFEENGTVTTDVVNIASTDVAYEDIENYLWTVTQVELSAASTPEDQRQYGYVLQNAATGLYLRNDGTTTTLVEDAYDRNNKATYFVTLGYKQIDGDDLLCPGNGIGYVALNSTSETFINTSTTPSWTINFYEVKDAPVTSDELNQLYNSTGFNLAISAEVTNLFDNNKRVRALNVDGGTDGVVNSTTEAGYGYPSGTYFVVSTPAGSYKDCTSDVEKIAYLDKCTFIAVASVENDINDKAQREAGQGYQLIEILGSDLNKYTATTDKQRMSRGSEVSVYNACFTVNKNTSSQYAIGLDKFRYNKNEAEKVVEGDEQTTASSAMYLNVLDKDGDDNDDKFLVTEGAKTDKSFIFTYKDAATVDAIATWLNENAMAAYNIQIVNNEAAEGMYLYTPAYEDATYAKGAKFVDLGTPETQYVITNVKEADNSITFANRANRSETFTAKLYQEADGVYSIAIADAANPTDPEYDFTVLTVDKDGNIVKEDDPAQPLNLHGQWVKITPATVDHYAGTWDVDDLTEVTMLFARDNTPTSNKLYVHYEEDATSSSLTVSNKLADAMQFQLVKSEKPIYLTNTYAYKVGSGDKYVVNYRTDGDTIAYYTYQLQAYKDGQATNLWLKWNSSDSQYELVTTTNNSGAGAGNFIIKDNYDAEGSVSIITTDEYDYTDMIVVADWTNTENEKIDEYDGHAITAGKLTQEMKAGYVKTYLKIESPDVTLDPKSTFVTMTSDLGLCITMQEDSRDAIAASNDPMTIRLFATDTDRQVPSFLIATGYDNASQGRMFLFNPADSVDYYVAEGAYDKEYQWEEDVNKLIFKQAYLNEAEAAHDTLFTTIKGKEVAVSNVADNNKNVQGGLDKFKFQIVLADDEEDLYWIRQNGAYVHSINGKLTLSEGTTTNAIKVKVEATDMPTANEGINAADEAVKVVATNGAVIVKGAEGKNVVVSTILGKVVANEVLNSDNETIAAPAGIVVVSVDGESFKVAVK